MTLTSGGRVDKSLFFWEVACFFIPHIPFIRLVLRNTLTSYS